MTFDLLTWPLTSEYCRGQRRASFHIPLTNSTTLNRLLHFSPMAIFRGSFVNFEGSFLHLGGEIARSPCILFPWHSRPCAGHTTIYQERGTHSVLLLTLCSSTSGSSRSSGSGRGDGGQMGLYSCSAVLSSSSINSVVAMSD